MAIITKQIPHHRKIRTLFSWSKKGFWLQNPSNFVLQPIKNHDLAGLHQTSRWYLYVCLDNLSVLNFWEKYAEHIIWWKLNRISKEKGGKKEFCTQKLWQPSQLSFSPVERNHFGRNTFSLSSHHLHHHHHHHHSSHCFSPSHLHPHHQHSCSCIKLSSLCTLAWTVFKSLK